MHVLSQKEMHARKASTLKSKLDKTLANEIKR